MLSSVCVKIFRTLNIVFHRVNSVTAPRRGKVSMTGMIQPPQEVAGSSMIDAKPSFQGIVANVRNLEDL